MIDLKEYIASLIHTYKGNDKATAQNIITFLEDNNWFGSRPEFIEGKVELTDEQIQLYSEPLEVFLTTEATTEAILSMFSEKFPETASLFERFREKVTISSDLQFYLLDFLLVYLKKDLFLYTDIEVKELVHTAANELTKGCGDVLTFFLSWLRTKTSTKYYSDYVMQKRYTMDIQNQAYAMDEYLKLSYYLFNDSYIEENDMYCKAAESKNYTDTWLYLCMHFITALRLTDLQRLYHPDLMYPAQEIIDQIATGTFSDSDARTILLSITVRLSVLPFTPSKTAVTSGVSSVHVSIPHSCEVHFGRLFALAEAHRQLSGHPDEPIIRKVSTYDEITRAMGDEIGSLFLESDFRARSATKSYLQLIFSMADDALESKKATVKGYILASLARSHKGGYGTFAQTTIEYLKDMHLNGYDPKFVAYELLERGVLSFIPGMLLNVVTDREYDALTVQGQTKLLKELSLSPFEVNATIDTVVKGRKQAQEAVTTALKSGEDILTVLQRIASGQAFSKESDCLCLNTACGRICPYPNRSQCIGCEYEISTKSTLFLLISEYRRTKTLYETSKDPLEKEKYKQLACTLILPKMNEMLTCLKQDYGKDCYDQYVEILRKHSAREMENKS